MQKMLMALLGFFAFTYSFAQAPSPASVNIGTIQGTAIDSADRAALSYVTVAVMEIGSNQPLKNTFTKENGSFIFTELPEKPHTLVLNYVGYKTKTIKLPPSTSATIDLGQIMLTPKATLLKEVQVVAQKPLVKAKKPSRAISIFCIETF